MKLSKRKIEIARARCGMTDKEIAKKYGATVTATRFMYADKNVQPYTAGRLAKALGVDVTEILDDSELQT